MKQKTNETRNTWHFNAACDGRFSLRDLSHVCFAKGPDLADTINNKCDFGWGYEHPASVKNS